MELICDSSYGANEPKAERFHVYTIEGGLYRVGMNVAAVRLAESGGVLILIAYRLYEANEGADPTVVVLEENDRNTERM